MRQIRDQILDHRHVWQRIDFHIALNFIHTIDTGQCVDPIDVHRTRSTNPLATRPAERQGWINFVFDLNQRIQNHRATGIHVHEIGINAWVFTIIWRPAIDIKFAQIGCAFWLGPCFSTFHTGIFGQCKLNHNVVPFYALTGVKIGLDKSLLRLQ